MRTSTDQVIDALRTEHDSLAALISGLDDDGRNRPSGASEWTIAQVLSHLGSGAEISRANLEATLAGGPPPGPDFNPSVWDRWNAKSALEMTSDFVSANEALLRTYEGVDRDTRGTLSLELSFLPEPIDLGTFAGMRLNEFTLHSWDVFVAFDPAATLLTPGPNLMVDRTALLFGYINRPEGLNGKRALLAVHTSEPERHFGLDLGDSISLVDAPGAPDGELRLPTESWLRLISGRLAPEHTPAGVTLTGSDVDLDDLRRTFPGY